MKILFIGVNPSLVLPIVNEMRKQDHSVTFLENGEISHYEYLNTGERVSNMLAKALTKTNLKQQRTWLATSQFLNGFIKGRNFDITIITNPDIYTREHLELIKSISDNLVCHLWDSIDRMPRNMQNIDVFDKVLSFDPKDIREQGFTEVSNYFNSSQLPRPEQNQGDLFGIFLFNRERQTFIRQMLDANPQLKTKIIIVADNRRKKLAAKHPRIEVVSSPILGEQLDELSSKYKAILDVGYQSQQGLSFRFFDSLAYEQKLVTTNSSVKQYPFYNPNNIHCISKQYPEISADFFATPYQKVADDIKLQYRLDHWVKNILSLMLK